MLLRLEFVSSLSAFDDASTLVVAASVAGVTGFALLASG
jgi:hypothetical protein